MSGAAPPIRALLRRVLVIGSPLESYSTPEAGTFSFGTQPRRRVLLAIARSMRHIDGMSEKLSYGFVESSYPQARIEAAFAQVFNVPAERIKVLRGRIKHLM